MPGFRRGRALVMQAPRWKKGPLALTVPLLRQPPALLQGKGRKLSLIRGRPGEKTQLHFHGTTLGTRRKIVPRPFLPNRLERSVPGLPQGSHCLRRASRWALTETARATVTKCQGWAGLNSRTFLFIIPEEESLRWRCQHGQLLVRALFLDCRWLSSCWVLIWRERERDDLLYVSSYFFFLKKR